MNKSKDPAMLKAVWNMKEKVYKETKNLNYSEYFKYISDKAKLFLFLPNLRKKP